MEAPKKAEYLFIPDDLAIDCYVEIETEYEGMEDHTKYIRVDIAEERARVAYGRGYNQGEKEGIESVINNVE